MASEIFDGLDDTSSDGIAAAVAQSVRDGALEAGTKLPTVRDLAARLGVSPATVSHAWRKLSAAGILRTRGRNGTEVVEQSAPSTGSRYSRVGGFSEGYRWNLATGTPDPSLLPDFGAALRSMDLNLDALDYHGPEVIPSLVTALQREWPYRPESLTVVNGCMDAIERLIRQSCRFGDRVIVESPTYPAILDLLEMRGIEAVTVDVDDEGIVPESLEHALSSRPVALLAQPRSQNPTGASWTPARLEQLSAVVGGTDLTLIEDDHSGPISCAERLSLGSAHPGRTATVLGFSKSHGPDLRLAALGGARRLVEPVSSERHLGPGWSSRILQQILSHFLTDSEARKAVARAAATYSHRRLAAVEALAGAGIHVRPGDGVNLWIPVRSETDALVTLASAGVKAAPGSPFDARKAPGVEHIRITIASVAEWPPELVSAFAGMAEEHSGARAG